MPRYESENRIRKITLKNIYRNNTGKLVCGVWKLPEAEMLEQNQYHCSYYEYFTCMPESIEWNIIIHMDEW